MKKYKFFVYTGYVLVIVIAVTSFLFLSFQMFDLSRNYVDLIYYYESMQNYELANIYIYLYLFTSLIYLPLYVIVTFASIIKNRLFIDYDFKGYPHIKENYRGFFYFKLTGLVILIGICTAIVYFINNSIIVFNSYYLKYFKADLFVGVIIMTFTPISYLLFGRGYKKLNKNIENIRRSNFEIKPGIDYPYREYKIIPFFYIAFILVVLSLGYTLNKFNSYSKYRNIPNEFILVKKSAFEKFGINRYFQACHINNKTTHLFCLDEDVLEHYKLTSLSFTLQYVLEEDDQVILRYHNTPYSLSQKDFVVVEENGNYTYFINFEGYLKKNNLKHKSYKGLTISVVSNEDEELPYIIQDFSITLNKMDDNLLTIDIFKSWWKNEE